jgi:hypothetical protein
MKLLAMKQLIPIAITAGMLVIGGCASTSSLQVRADYDRTVVFTQYKTFGFESPLGTDKNGYQSLVSKQLMASTEREMAARGIVLDNNAPQLLVNFNANLANQMRVTTTPVPSMPMGGYYGGGYYGYRTGFYSPWPTYQDQTRVTNYKEGTLNIDVIDASRKQLVWEGVVTDTITKKDMTNIQPTLDNAVTAAFASFPVQRK